MLFDDELYMLKSNKIYVMLCYVFDITRAYALIFTISKQAFYESLDF